MSKKTSTSQLILNEVKELRVILESLKQEVTSLSNKVSAMEDFSKSSKNSKKSSPKKTKIVKSGSVCLNSYNDAILVTGQTYDKRAVLKKYRALWNKDKKGWSIKLEHFDDLKKDLESHCSKVDEKSIDEYFFDEPGLNSIGSNNSCDDHSVDSSYNPIAKYAFLDDE